MFPAGMLPVNQLVAMLRNTPPQGAAGLLMAMPADRLPVVVAAMRTADIVRVLPAAKPAARGTLIAALSTGQLIELVRTTSRREAVELLTGVPEQRLGDVADGLSDEAVSVLAGALPAGRQHALLATMDQRRVCSVLARMYERDVAAALTRANTTVEVPDGMPGGLLVVRTLGWTIVVAPRYGDDGRVAVRHAEDGAYHVRANAALSVTNHPPADETLRYCREARRAGRPVDAVSWTDDRHDGPLTRTLVSLCQ